MGLHLNEGFQVDLIVEELLLTELKSVDQLAPCQTGFSSLKVLYLPLGLHQLWDTHL